MNKIFLSLLPAVVGVALLLPSAQGQCTVGEGVDGVSNVTIYFKPRPIDVISQFTSMESPGRVFELLQSYSNLGKSAATFIKAWVPPIPPILGKKYVIPSCEYLWIDNALVCENLNSMMVTTLCGAFPQISNVTKQFNITLPKLPVEDHTCEDDTTYPWGVKKIQAPEAWAMGFKGEGIVVANIDTGVRWTHQELRDNMRSTYNWKDPYGISKDVPTDVHGHGTHTMGTMVGKTVGVAPNAKWIACRGCNSQTCEDAQLKRCGQFLACPDENVLNCTTKPDVINNSWGGGIGNTMFLNVLAVWKAMGIASFFSSGNDGPLCSTVKSPADSNWTVTGILSVGSTACNNQTSSFSSAGPSQAADYMGGLGVSIVGPGTNVNSSWYTSDNAYNIISGTSMSSPAVTGSGAVILSKRKRKPQELYKVMMETATRDMITNAITEGCGPEKTNQNGAYPNNKYGWGEVNVLRGCEAP